METEKDFYLSWSKERERWYIRVVWWENGRKRSSWRSGGKTKEGAGAKLEQFEQEWAKKVQEYYHPEETKIWDLADRFLKEKWGDNQKNQMWCVFGKMEREWGERPLRSITTGEIREWLETAPSDRSYNLWRQGAQRLFGLAEEYELIEGNPMNRIKPRRLKIKKRQPPSDEQMNDIMRAALRPPKAPRYLYRAMLIARHQGFRLKTIIGLKWGHLRNGWWKIPGGITKNGEDLEVPANQAVLDHLEPLREGGEVWIIDTPSSWKAKSRGAMLRREFKDVCGKAGVDAKFHDFRRYFATTAIKKGIDAATVAKMGGWADTNTLLRRYVSTDNERLVEGMRRMM